MRLGKFLKEKPDQSESTAVGQAVLTEAIRHVDIIHTSLAGMTAIVLILVGVVSMPLFGMQPLIDTLAIHIIAITVVVGIAVLYFMNYYVYHHVAHQASLTEVLVNSLGQGFLTFNQQGMCGIVYSQACHELLETTPSEKHIAEVLAVPDARRGDFKDWMDVLFMPNHALGFDDVTNFLPQFFPHSQGRRIRLAYRPIRDNSGSLREVVMIATDETEGFVATQEAKNKQLYAEMICRIFKDRNQFQMALSYLRNCIESANNPNLKKSDSAPLLRQLHTLKAAVRHFSLKDLGEIIHQLETDLRNPSLKSDEDFRKVLHNGAELLSSGLTQVMIDVKDLLGNNLSSRGSVREVDEDSLYEFAQHMLTSNVDASLLKEYLEGIVAVPILDCLRSFESDMKDLIESMDKQIKPVQFIGNNPRILVKPLQDFLLSLAHICRNVADHGIEAPAVRLARGKDPAAQVIFKADLQQGQEEDFLVIEISDDGNGIDPQRVREKLSVTDPEGAWRTADDHTVIQAIFGWGFSTREGVTDISGRGVGLEAVHREVKMLGGSISVRSKFGLGSTFLITIPYSLNSAFLSN